jgi:hypothetical protein
MKHTASDGKPARRHNGGETAAPPVTRAEFEAVIKQLNKRDDLIDALRQELHAACLGLTDDIRRDLHTQFTRIAQMQQQIDGLMRQHSG